MGRLNRVTSRLRHITADEVRNLGTVASETPGKLRSRLQTLLAESPGAYAEVVAVMRVGRGDDDPEHFELATAFQIIFPDLVECVVEKSRLLRAFLENGLHLLGEPLERRTPQDCAGF
jgi:hypothetical protein